MLATIANLYSNINRPYYKTRTEYTWVPNVKFVGEGIEELELTHATHFNNISTSLGDTGIGTVR